MLDFQKDHTVKTLKAFLGAHRLPHPPAKLQSSEGQAYDKILRREKADLPIFAYQLTEQLHDREVFLKIVLQGPAGVFDDVFSDLSGDDD